MLPQVFRYGCLVLLSLFDEVLYLDGFQARALEFDDDVSAGRGTALYALVQV